MIPFGTLEHFASFETVFNSDLSKNKRYVGRFKKVLRKEHRDAREEVETACARAIADCEPLDPKTRILVSLTVYKPNNRMDAHNFIDDALDAIESAIGVNDRYYSTCCHWHIDKDNPRIEFELFTIFY